MHTVPLAWNERIVGILWIYQRFKWLCLAQDWAAFLKKIFDFLISLFRENDKSIPFVHLKTPQSRSPMGPASFLGRLAGLGSVVCLGVSLLFKANYVGLFSDWGERHYYSAGALWLTPGCILIHEL